MIRRILAGVAGIALTFAVATPARAQWAVFDASNFAENVMQAARALQQINNQITSLQNQATMLSNQATNLQSLTPTSLNTMMSSLTQIGGLMNQGQGIAFNVTATQSAYSQYYPQQYSTALTDNQFVADAQTRWQQAKDAFGQALNVQSQVVQNVQTDSGTLATLTSQSQNATGNLQELQALGQLVAFSIKQQLQIENLLAAQARANTLAQAGSAESDAEATAEANRFLGSPNIYTPQ